MNPLIVICGPTATGKTSLALKLCHKFNGEIISADSRQIYKELDIGSGRGSSQREEVEIIHGDWVEQGIPIYLYNILEPGDRITVAKYSDLAWVKIKAIWGRNKIPFLVGGTGFYISAVIGDIEIEKVLPNPKLRAELENLSKEELFSKLKSLDPQRAKDIDKNNPRRLIRAIEILAFKAEKDIQTSKNHAALEKLKPLMVGLIAPREVLYKRIDERTDGMLKEGLLDEVEGLVQKYGWDTPAMAAIGYRQFKDYFDGREVLEEAIKKKKFSEHAYLRRQITWFKRNTRIKWFEVTKEGFDVEVETLIESYLEKYG